MSELDPAYRDIEVCPCSTPGWKHHTGFHDFVADRVERAVKQARREGAAEVGSAVEAWASKNEIAAPPLDWAWLGEITAWARGDK